MAIDDIETTVDEVDGQEDMQMVYETKVTHHTMTKALVEMEVTSQDDIDITL